MNAKFFYSESEVDNIERETKLWALKRIKRIPGQKCTQTPGSTLQQNSVFFPSCGKGK